MTTVIAHRGASAHAPENTLAAFRLAGELGATWVELDVRATRDGALAVHHDEHLADGRAIAALAARDLPAEVPLLADALQACGPLAVNVEIKEAPVPDVLAVVAAWGGEVLVSSFDHRVVDEVRRLDPAVPTAQLTFLLRRPLEETVAWVAERGHRWWHPFHGIVDEPTLAAARGAGLGVNAWTVDDPDRVAELAAWGVDGIVTNDVPTAVAALSRGGRA